MVCPGVHTLTEPSSRPGPGSVHAAQGLESRSKQRLTSAPCPLPPPSRPLAGHLCRTRPTDLVFVVDSSRSVRPVEFEKVKVFLSQVIESLDVGPNATRVGVVNYASAVKQEFPLQAHGSKAALLRAVRRIRPLSTGTMTGLAIQFAISKAFSDAEGGRARAPDISKVHVRPSPPHLPCQELHLRDSQNLCLIVVY